MGAAGDQMWPRNKIVFRSIANEASDVDTWCIAIKALLCEEWSCFPDHIKYRRLKLSFENSEHNPPKMGHVFHF